MLIGYLISIYGFVISTEVIEGAKRADHVAEKSSAARYTSCFKAPI